MKLQPLNKRIVVIQKDEEQTRRVAGTNIELVTKTDKARGKQQVGVIVAVASDLDLSADGLPPVEVGQKVLFAKYAGTEYKDEDTGEDLLIVELADLLAIVK